MGVGALYHSWWEGDGVAAVIAVVVPSEYWPKETAPTGGFTTLELLYVTDESGASVTDESLELVTLQGLGSGFAAKETEPSLETWGLEVYYVTDENGDFVTDESSALLTVDTY